MIAVIIAALAILSGAFTFMALWTLMPLMPTRYLSEAQRDAAAAAAIAVTLIVAISLGTWA